MKYILNARGEQPRRDVGVALRRLGVGGSINISLVRRGSDISRYNLYSEDLTREVIDEINTIAGASLRFHGSKTTLYRRNTNCGKMIIEIDDQRQMTVGMEKFGPCMVYKFIGDQLTHSLVFPVDMEDVPMALQSKEYKCQKGPDGCIQVVGRVLEEHFFE